jgi:hypothetical protein
MHAWKCDEKRNTCPEGGCLLIVESAPIACVIHKVGDMSTEPSGNWNKIELWSGANSGWEPYARSRVYSNADIEDRKHRNAIADAIPTDLDFEGQKDAWETQFTTFIFKNLQPKDLRVRVKKLNELEREN